MRAYYQTTPMTTVQLDAAFREASLQDDLVLATFRTGLTVHHTLMSPSQVHAVGVKRGSQWLLTSVRRSIATLTRAGVLVKTGFTRQGPHGKPEYLWRLADTAGSV